MNKLTIIIITSFLIFNFSCKLNKKKNSNDTNYKIFNYPEGKKQKGRWTEVDSLYKKGLPKSALKVIQEIYTQALKENNVNQVIKATIHKLNYNQRLKEDNYIHTIHDLNELIKTSETPQKQLIHSILAEKYWNYYQQNRWRINNRTAVINFNQNDIRTWSLKDIVHNINKHYAFSLSNKTKTQSIDIKSFKDILVMGNKVNNCQPTLYDFLAHRALNFYINTEPDITKPAYYFQIDKKDYYNNAQSFANLNISTKDTSSSKLKALLLFQDLTRFHFNIKNKTALADLDMNRVNFIHTYNTVKNNDALYIQSLKDLSSTHKDVDIQAEILLHQAKYYLVQGNKYNKNIKDDPNNDQLKGFIKKAVTICNKAIKNYPLSYGAGHAINLISQIQQKNFYFKCEAAIIPNEINKGLIQFKNIDHLHFKIIKINFDVYSDLQNRSIKQMIQFYNQQKIIKKWNQKLPNDGLYHSHSVEFIIPSLDKGFYGIIASADSNFNDSFNATALTTFWSTNISYVFRNKTNLELTLLNRKTGLPLNNVKTTMYYKDYNYKKKKQIIKQTILKTSDKNGYIRYSKFRKYRRNHFNFIWGNDRFNNIQYVYSYGYNNRDKRESNIVVFTDRSIYRPGQKVFFKSLLYTQKEFDAKIMANKKVTITLYDANYQKVESKTITTNQFGTVSGYFIIPTGLMNGRMRIQCLYGKNTASNKYFNIEEYKRPKFNVTMQPIKGEYKLGNTIKTIGLAKAFAGNPIDGAKVKYSVTRTASFPWWCRYYYGFNPSSASLQLENGSTKTDEKGNFNINFTAIPDESILIKYGPTYSYLINADVTDINGETHSVTNFVNVGYSSLKLNIDIPEEVDVDQSHDFPITSKNLNGEKLITKGTLTIFKIKENPRLEKNKQWENPDIFLMDKIQHDTLFPHRNFGDKSKNELQEIGKEQIAFYSFDTKKETKLFSKNINKLPLGKYQIELKAKDKFGVDVKEIKHFTLFNAQSKSMAINEYFWSKAIKSSGEPGDSATFIIGSKAKNMHILYEIEHKNKIVKSEWILLNNEQKSITVPIEEKHRGNFTIHFIMVNENRVYSTYYTITVPHTHKKLDISFETFRDKLLPGQKEKWKINIKGANKDKVLAEMLATMYDASLDEFTSHNISLSIYGKIYGQLAYKKSGFIVSTAGFREDRWNIPNTPYSAKIYNRLNWFGRYGNNITYRWNFGDRNLIRGNDNLDGVKVKGLYSKKEYRGRGDQYNFDNESSFYSIEDKLFKGFLESDKDGVNDIFDSIELGNVSLGLNNKLLSQIKARKNFNETAFFLPHLTTNQDGDISFEFEMPEALTKWKFLSLAHTKDMKIGRLEKEIITQKDLMVIPNVPRFFREGDQITISTKISNISDKVLNGHAQLFLFDALNNKEIDIELNNKSAKKPFITKAKGSTSVDWTIQIPIGFQAIKYKIVAGAGNFTDGEENAIPVLTNRMLVTESMSLPVNKKGTYNFELKKLINSASSTSLKNHKLTLEYTSNPAWYVIQAMPYMMEYPYDCAEQTFTRFYSNSLATHIMNSSPKIKTVIQSWKKNSPEEFLSNLEKNEELKSLLLQETPWVMAAKSESKRKKRISELFNLSKMSSMQSKALNKLNKMQLQNGAWPWFKGMRESRYISQYIVTGLGHLENLNVKDITQDQKTWNMTKKAIAYLDNAIVKDYENLKKHNINYVNGHHLSYMQIQYLYARSFFKMVAIPNQTKEAYEYYLNQSKKHWLKYNNYSQGMIALANHRNNPKSILPKQIMASLKENAIIHKELGMYWKGMMYGGYYWHQAPIETQSLMIEAFETITDDNTSVNLLKTWLLKQKQTNDWKTTKATAEACYALLINGTDILSSTDIPNIKVGELHIDAGKAVHGKNRHYVKTNSGTGYLKTSWNDSEITPSMGKVTVSKTEDGVSWGALYWQYFQDLDKITPHQSPLSLDKKLFIEKVTDKGKVLHPISPTTKLKVGDKVIVRIVLKVDRNMEYVHMKDMRASGLEPINVISRYKWQDGLGYYESTKDASTNFFFDQLPRGTFVFEYPLRVSQKGNFSNGITSIQSMYAPEFGSHSEGIRIVVE